jgi:hypothetical protein
MKSGKLGERFFTFNFQFSTFHFQKREVYGMNVKQIYERVSLVTPVWQRQFFDRLNDTIIELEGAYGEVPKLLYVTGADGEIITEQWVKSLDEELIILPLYHPAIVDNILYLSNAGEVYKQEFARKAYAAWLEQWNIDAKDRRVKKGGACLCLKAE